MPVFTCISPIDDGVLATRPFATEDEIAAAVTAARAAQRDWRNQPISARMVSGSGTDFCALKSVHTTFAPPSAWMTT